MRLRIAIPERFQTRIWALAAIETYFVVGLSPFIPNILQQLAFVFYSVGGVILVCLLGILEKRQLPFPYSEKLPASRHIVWTIVSFVEIVGVWLLLGLISSVKNPFPIVLEKFFVPSIQSIFEESLKVLMINGFAIGIGRLWTRGIFWDRRILIAGVISVSIWTLGHVPIRHYDSITLCGVFLAGVVMFYVTYRTRNIFPAIYIHLLCNAFLP